MAIRLCVSGFGRDWDGTYEEIDFGKYAKIPDHDYWIYRSSLFWFISSSEYLYLGEGRRLAQNPTNTYIMDPSGTYYGVFGEPDGEVQYGECT